MKKPTKKPFSLNKPQSKTSSHEQASEHTQASPSAKETKPKETPQELKEQIKKAMTSYLYLKAEFENYKKQALKEKQSLVRYGGEAFIQFFIENIVDDLERALSTHSQNQNIEDFKKGLTLIQNKIKQTFVHFGISELNPQGKTFDPESQEALGKEKNSKIPHGSVSQVLKKGYKLHDKVIRPAQVIIAENESSQEQSEKFEKNDK